MKKDKYNPLHIDLETFCHKEFELGTWKYGEHPSTEILIACYKKPAWKTARLWVAGQPMPAEIKNHKGYFVAHNAAFEFTVLYNKGKKYGFPASTRDPARWLCTQSMARSLNMPASLADAGAFLNTKVQKSDSGKELIELFSKPKKKKDRKTKIVTYSKKEYTKAQFNAFCRYCRDDVLTEGLIYQRLINMENVQLDLPVYLLDFKQNFLGLPIDIKTLQKVRQVLDKRILIAEKKSEKLGLNVRSPKQLIEWLKGQGVAVENTQEKTITDLLRVTKSKKIKEVLNLRIFLSRSSVKKFDTVFEWMSPDNFLRFFLKYYGAHTGRWAGQGPQLLNLPRADGLSGAALEKLIKEFITGRVPFADTMTAAKKIIPGMFKAIPGESFLSGDFKAIEARILNLLAGQKDITERFRRDEPIYELMASKIFGKNIDLINKSERFFGKKVELGSGYQMGADKFFTVCIQEGINISFDLADRSVKTYRREHPKVVQWWYNLDRAFKMAWKTKGQEIRLGRLTFFAGSNYIKIKLPSGRYQYYHNIKVDSRGFSYLNFQRRMRVHLYGGILAENICQGVSRDILTYCMLELDKKKIRTVLHVYDEIVCNIKTAGAAGKRKIFEKITNTAPPWLPDLPLKTEVEIQKRYHK